MSAAAFHLVTDWRLAAPREAVWQLLTHPEDWPSWWPAVESVETVEPGDRDGIGAYRRMTWRTALPYRVHFNMRTTRVDALSLIEGRADGGLTGLGRWSLRGDDASTQVRYDWIVDVTEPWMRALAPALRPVFAWNHRRVMDWGHEGIVARLAGPPQRT